MMVSTEDESKEQKRIWKGFITHIKGNFKDISQFQGFNNSSYLTCVFIIFLDEMMITVLTWKYLQNIPQPIHYEQISRRDRG